MIPSQVWSTTEVLGDYLEPDHVPASLLQDQEMGGIALQDPSEGLDLKVWRAWREELEDTIWVAPLDGSHSPVAAFTGVLGATWISLTFDQNMRHVLAWQMPEGQVFLYWYDTVIEGYSVSSWSGRMPRLVLDDHRDGASSWSDVILFYLAGDQLVMRQQRDRFGVEYPMGTVGLGARMGRVGMTDRLRLQVEVYGAGP